MKIILFSALFSFVSLLFGQSSSVFDASYFNIGGNEPPIRLGKGFHITDPFKQTRFCFTPESIKNITPQQTGAKTTINVYHTFTNAQHKSIRNMGASGKVSFLNLFSLGANYMDENFSYKEEETERLTFVMKVDWGKFDFPADPILTEEAQKLIDEKQFKKFTEIYGTHYISGVRKEASIYVVLEKQKSLSIDRNQGGQGLQGAIKVPQKINASAQAKNTNEQEVILSSGSFSVNIEINGATLNKNTIENAIVGLLSGSETEKAKAIAEIISKAAGKITSSDNALISQYYFTPFSLFGVENIFWDSKKENQLADLNSKAIQIYQTKQLIGSMLSENPEEDIIAQKLKPIQSIVETPENHSYLTDAFGKLSQTFEDLEPELIKCKEKLENHFTSLEKDYYACSSVECPANSSCCSLQTDNAEVASTLSSAKEYCDKIQNDINEIFEAAWQAREVEKQKYLAELKEANKLPCEKNRTFKISISNLSKNPYNLYWNNQYLYQLSGGETKTWEFQFGRQNFRAEQVSGYLLYPTINYRTITPQSPCQDWTVKVGFED